MPAGLPAGIVFLGPIPLIKRRKHKGLGRPGHRMTEARMQATNLQSNEESNSGRNSPSKPESNGRSLLGSNPDRNPWTYPGRNAPTNPERNRWSNP